ncbi:Rv3235 family protein [Cellulomonas sp. P22]|uniref:Rv3235 family protein n=1 Tax=Cellulomonas sp. P22 TaxID=3373189 RepID=UPI0037A1209A
MRRPHGAVDDVHLAADRAGHESAPDEATTSGHPAPTETGLVDATRASQQPAAVSSDRPPGPAKPVRVRLVPEVPHGPRSRPPAGPGHSRPPTLEERALARRRAALDPARAETPGAPATEALPEPTALCCSIVLVALEALHGTRSIAQLARWVTPEVYEQLAARVAVTVRALGAARPTARPEVRRARVCRLGGRVAEASVVVQDGARVRAVALRLEERRGAWRAVALEIG